MVLLISEKVGCNSFCRISR